MQGISVRLAVTLICIVAGASIGGGILGYYLARKEQKIRQLAHRLSKEGRAERKRRDTENNIGNRFWKLAEKYILENSVYGFGRKGLSASAQGTSSLRPFLFLKSSAAHPPRADPQPSQPPGCSLTRFQ